MRTSPILALVVAILCAHGASSDNCFTQSGSNIRVNGACTFEKTTILSKTGEFTIDTSAGTEDLKSEGTLKIGDCAMKLKLTVEDREGTLKVNGYSFDLPAVATIKQGIISFVDKKRGTPYELPLCSPSFTKVDEGQKIYVEYSMSSSDLRMLFTGVSLYSNSSKKRSLSTSMKILIGVLIAGIVLGGLALVGFLILRSVSNRKKHAKQSKEEKKPIADKKQALEKALDKPVAEKALDKPVVEKKACVKKAPEKPKAKKIDPIVKQVDETQSFEDIPVIKPKSPPVVQFSKPIPGRKPSVSFSREIDVELTPEYIPRTAKQAVSQRVTRRSVSPAKNTIEEWQARRTAKSDPMIEEMRIEESFPGSEDDGLDTAFSP